MDSLISVILPIYKTPIGWVQLAIDSILNQSYSALECIVVNDDPENLELKQLLIAYSGKDKRIVLVENEINLGLPASLNRAIAIAKGKYIARMDADDISVLERLDIQFKYMELHPEISLCGAQVLKMDEEMNMLGQSKNPVGPMLVRRVAKYKNPTSHSSWMFRKTDLIKMGNYNLLPNAEDYELIRRMLSQGSKVTNLSATLVKYRVHAGGVSWKRSLEQKLCIAYIQRFYDKSAPGKNFDLSGLKSYLVNGLEHSGNSNDNLLKARIGTTTRPIKKLILLFRSFFSSKIERRYLVSLFLAQLIQTLSAFSLTNEND